MVHLVPGGSVMIPKVRHWRVRYWMGKTLLADIVVATINKRFALWEARDCIIAKHLDRYIAADRISVSLAKTDASKDSNHDS
jgi:hypothetical protein